jgi:restriction system protein
MAMRPISKSELRNIISNELSRSIEVHRSSRVQQNQDYIKPTGDPTDEEIDDFILTNPMYEIELATQLVDTGLLGFGFQSGVASKEAFDEFVEQTLGWASTNEWLAADLIPYHSYLGIEPQESRLWIAKHETRPSWLKQTPSALILAAELLHNGKLLSDLGWRAFEEVVAGILEREGWHVDLTRSSKDGGVDIYTSRDDETIGKVRAIWQAKKYKESNKVGLSEVRELSGVLERSGSTKGVLVTTSHLTRGALEWVKQDIYRLSYKDKEQIEDWVRKHI